MQLATPFHDITEHYLKGRFELLFSMEAVYLPQHLCSAVLGSLFFSKQVQRFAFECHFRNYSMVLYRATVLGMLRFFAN